MSWYRTILQYTISVENKVTSPNFFEIGTFWTCYLTFDIDCLWILGCLNWRFLGNVWRVYRVVSFISTNMHILRWKSDQYCNVENHLLGHFYGAFLLLILVLEQNWIGGLVWSFGCQSNRSFYSEYIDGFHNKATLADLLLRLSSTGWHKTSGTIYNFKVM